MLLLHIASRHERDLSIQSHTHTHTHTHANFEISPVAKRVVLVSIWRSFEQRLGRTANEHPRRGTRRKGPPCIFGYVCVHTTETDHQQSQPHEQPPRNRPSHRNKKDRQSLHVTPRRAAKGKARQGTAQGTGQRTHARTHATSFWETSIPRRTGRVLPTY